MSTRVTLPFWPGSYNCLSWSEDNQIAVVGGESVVILLPKLGNSSDQWDTVYIKVSRITTAEIPNAEPLTDAPFSIGKELSARKAISAAWSPPGLAVHRGCVLAVLTANHVLSLWAPKESPTQSKNWEPKLIINQSVRKFYTKTGGSKRSTKNEHKDFRQIDERVTSFAWSPPLAQAASSRVQNSLLSWGAHILAVATVHGDILFVHVRSPHLDSPEQSDWSAKVVGGCKISKHHENSTMRAPWQFRPANPIAHHIAWSRWSPARDEQTGNTSTAIFAYISNGKLFSTTLSTTDKPRRRIVDTLSQHRRHLSNREDIAGPLHVVPDATSVSLVAFGPDVILQTRLSADASLDDVSEHHLDERWDDITGATLTNSKDDGTSVHFASHVTSAATPTAVLRLPLSATQSSRQPNWQDAIVISASDFGYQNRLGNRVQERTWGIASSPFHDLIATCISLVPTDLAQYRTSCQQFCVVAITHQSRTVEGRFPTALFLPRKPSAEAVLFSKQREYEGRIAAVERSHLKLEIYEMLYPEPLEESAHEVESEDTAEEQILRLRETLYNQSWSKSDRATQMADMVVTHKKSLKINRCTVALLIKTILAREDVEPADDFTESMLDLYRVIHARLDQGTGTRNHTAHSSESCNFCLKEIKFENLQRACCATGHRFTRCALSFLAIQEPDISKFCGLCGLEYLSDAMVAKLSADSDEEDTQNVERSDPVVDATISKNDSGTRRTRTRKGNKIGVGRLLFAACDVCLYCGGRFTD